MMLGLLKVYVFLTAVDMRKSIDALALLVQGSGFSWADASAQSLGFVFFSKDRTKLKLLVWESNGFWLCYKRLEQGKFLVPEQSSLSWQELMLMLQGIDLSRRRLLAVAISAVA